MNSLYLNIGSNIEPEDNFRKCKAALQQYFTETRWSPIYRSSPVGMKGPDFLNAAVHVYTERPLNAIPPILKNIEISQGRIKQQSSFSDRTLDIDLLLYNDICIDSQNLKLPRPELLTMGFVLVPMVDIAPSLIHPEMCKTLQVLLDELKESNPQQLKSLSQVDWTL